MNAKNNNKICIVLPFFGDGGMERAVMNLSSGFMARGIQVDLVLIKKGYGGFDSEIPKGVNVVALEAKNYFHGFFKLVGYLRQSVVQSIVSLATPTNLICIFANLILAKKFRLLVSTQVTLADVGVTKFYKRLLKKCIYKIYNLADVVHAPSLGVSKDLENLGVNNNRIKVIYNPVVSPQILELSLEALDDAWFIQREVPVILGIGRLVPQKDFPTLLRAFALARKERSLRLAILGEGEKRESLLTLAKELHIEDDFKLLGFSNNPYKYLKNTSLFVLSSAWEGFGNVLAEAIGIGVPAVSTDCPHGPKEILMDGKYGKLVAVGDYENLAKVILETLVDPPSPEFLKSGAERFAVANVTDEYIKALSLNLHDQ